jgi:hypothetical protein
VLCLHFGAQDSEFWSLIDVGATSRPVSWLGNNITLPQVTGGKLHWRVFEVGKSLETDSVELQLGDIIEKIDDKGPKECTTKRSGCSPPPPPPLPQLCFVCFSYVFTV